MKTINITKRDGTRYEVLVDDEDYAKVVNQQWHITTPSCSGNIYAARSMKHNDKPMNIPMQNDSMNFDRTDPRNSELVIDHIDGNGLNNQKSNLRIVSQWQNTCNRRNSSDNLSGILGISAVTSTKGNTAGTFRGWAVKIKVKDTPTTHSLLYVGFRKNLADAVKLQNDAYAGIILPYSKRNNPNKKPVGIRCIADGKYRVCIFKNGKRIYLGTTPTLATAIDLQNANK